MEEQRKGATDERTLAGFTRDDDGMTTLENSGRAGPGDRSELSTRLR